MLFWILFLIFGTLFTKSFIKERRLFRNAVYFIFTVFFLLIAISGSAIGSSASKLIFLLLFAFLPLTVFVTSFVFIVQGITSVRKDGFSLSHILSIGFGIGIWGLIVDFVLIFSNEISTFTREILILILMMGIYVLFTFSALLLYSFLYQIIPKGRKCDFIIVHGAGLLDGYRVSPLLARRLDKGIQVYNKSDKTAKIIVSGGQGSDENVSEAQAMKEYLLQVGIPEENIILEDQSTTTMENLQFSKKIMDDSMPSYRCIFVTNDYHVFRAGTYAREIGLQADGVGCKTAFYYWPNAFIREYIAIIIQHKKAPIVLGILWLMGVVVWHWLS